MRLPNFDVKNDLRVTQTILGIDDNSFASALNISSMTLYRWFNSNECIPQKSLELIYSYIYSQKIYLNKIKEQLYFDNLAKHNNTILFHCSKEGIKGKLSLKISKRFNDFGPGFYCGTNYKQSVMFASGYSNSSIYIFSFFKNSKLKYYEFNIDREWMIAIAYFRGRLDKYKDSPFIKRIIDKLKDVDYIIAPIADNKMFSIIESFINSELTDEQCQVCLSMTDLGKQYVFVSQAALDSLKPLSKCYLCQKEKNDAIYDRLCSVKVGIDKAKVAKAQFLVKGQYIESVLYEKI